MHQNPCAQPVGTPNRADCLRPACELKEITSSKTKVLSKAGEMPADACHHGSRVKSSAKRVKPACHCAAPPGQRRFKVSGTARANEMPSLSKFGSTGGPQFHGEGQGRRGLGRTLGAIRPLASSLCTEVTASGLRDVLWRLHSATLFHAALKADG